METEVIGIVVSIYFSKPKVQRNQTNRPVEELS